MSLAAYLYRPSPSVYSLHRRTDNDAYPGSSTGRRPMQPSRIVTSSRSGLPTDPAQWTDIDLVLYARRHYDLGRTTPLIVLIHAFRITPSVLWYLQTDAEELSSLTGEDLSLQEQLLDLAHCVRPTVSPTTPRRPHARQLSVELYVPTPPLTPPPPPEESEPPEEEEDVAPSVVSDWALDDQALEEEEHRGQGAEPESEHVLRYDEGEEADPFDAASAGLGLDITGGEQSASTAEAPSGQAEDLIDFDGAGEEDFEAQAEYGHDQDSQDTSASDVHISDTQLEDAAGYAEPQRQAQAVETAGDPLSSGTDGEEDEHSVQITEEPPSQSDDASSSLTEHAPGSAPSEDPPATDDVTGNLTGSGAEGLGDVTDELTSTTEEPVQSQNPKHRDEEETDPDGAERDQPPEPETHQDTAAPEQTREDAPRTEATPAPTAPADTEEPVPQTSVPAEHTAAPTETTTEQATPLPGPQAEGEGGGLGSAPASDTPPKPILVEPGESGSSSEGAQTSFATIAEEQEVVRGESSSAGAGAATVAETREPEASREDTGSGSQPPTENPPPTSVQEHHAATEPSEDRSDSHSGDETSHVHAHEQDSDTQPPAEGSAPASSASTSSPEEPPSTDPAVNAPASGANKDEEGSEDSNASPPSSHPPNPTTSTEIPTSSSVQQTDAPSAGQQEEESAATGKRRAFGNSEPSPTKHTAPLSFGSAAQSSTQFSPSMGSFFAGASAFAFSSPTSQRFAHQPNPWASSRVEEGTTQTGEQRSDPPSTDVTDSPGAGGTGPQPSVQPVGASLDDKNEEANVEQTESEAQTEVKTTVEDEVAEAMSTSALGEAAGESSRVGGETSDGAPAKGAYASGPQAQQAGTASKGEEADGAEQSEDDDVELVDKAEASDAPGSVQQDAEENGQDNHETSWENIVADQGREPATVTEGTEKEDAEFNTQGKGQVETSETADDHTQTLENEDDEADGEDEASGGSDADADGESTSKGNGKKQNKKKKKSGSKGKGKGKRKKS
ncbi:hypothetical protein BV20DRAFT_1053823 [Pilatotrama ljubarskyi]|nr:hypothetical protein BV20DRAFT_1053823 [Pilatotrama ljubarskyi]